MKKSRFIQPILFLTGLAVFLSQIHCDTSGSRLAGPRESGIPSNVIRIETHETKGPYKEQRFDLNESPYPESQVRVDVPEAEKISERIKPVDPPTRVLPFSRMNDTKERSVSANIRKENILRDHISGTNGQVPEPCIAENGATVLMTANHWMALSTDGGINFKRIDVSKVFPDADGGFCCDQVVIYVPRIDMFIAEHLTIYDDPNNKINRVRLAAATTSQLVSSGGTSWTYWDFKSKDIGAGSWLDYPDLSYGDNSIYMSCEAFGIGRVVCRMPMDQIKKKKALTASFSPPLKPGVKSRLSQNTGDEVFWGGALTNNQFQVFGWKEGSNMIVPHKVNVQAFPNTIPETLCENGANWSHIFMGFTFFGASRFENDLWIAWSADKGGAFPQPHVRLAKIDILSKTVTEEHQIWNQDIAFNYPHIALNNRGEVAVSLAFGGGDIATAQHGVGILGENVVHYPALSDTCVDVWGHYTTVRQSGLNPAGWAAVGYHLEKLQDISTSVPHYLRFEK